MECTAWVPGYDSAEKARAAAKDVLTGDKALWATATRIWLDVGLGDEVAVPVHTIRYITVREYVTEPSHPTHMLAARIIAK